jgi:predicted Zn-dependent protease
MAQHDYLEGAVMKRLTTILSWVILSVLLPTAVVHGHAAAGDPPAQHPLIEILGDELEYSMNHLVSDDGKKPYYMAYTVTDTRSLTIRARLGALDASSRSRRRVLDVDLRVGDYSVDNTRKLRGSAATSRRTTSSVPSIPVEDNPGAVRHAVWRTTDRAFKSATEQYQEVLTNLKTMVEEESQAADFSREEPEVYFEPEVEFDLDDETWEERVRNVSKLALKHPLVFSSSVTLTATATNRYMVTSEGTRLQTGQKLLRVYISANSKADDGMDLKKGFAFDAVAEERLPSEEQMAEEFQKVIEMVLALREAPLVEPYTGPAILVNRASGVFFHEIFGHRIEGDRQKDVDQGQTYAKMVGEQVLPPFISVVDDPTLARFGDVDLRGFYRYDDEGIAGSRVTVVDNGILESFLMCRSPVEGFPKSNGHGRRQPGRKTQSRQGNFMVHSSRSVSYEKLCEMLVDECKKQGKPFGLVFDDNSGGFTTTGRRGTQSFKVLPIVVYRVYVDGRPNELVRGVDIVGTPLTCFSKILCTADDPKVFNGSCGSASGSIPVALISPSILVEQIEIEKREHSQERLPILPSPIAPKEQ